MISIAIFKQNNDSRLELVQSGNSFCDLYPLYLKNESSRGVESFDLSLYKSNGNPIFKTDNKQAGVIY